MSTPKELLAEAGRKMEATIHALEREFGHLRAGRASASLVEHIKVMAYGAEMTVQQLANISTPDATSITIQPYDKSTLGAIEKAIRLSELNLTPANDGILIRLILPPLTEDRRKDLIKLVHKHAEEGRVALRNVRRDANDHIKRLLKDKSISEDEMHDTLSSVDKLLEKELASLEQHVKAKDKEITDF
jgi:ribosome recycling factor